MVGDEDGLFMSNYEVTANYLANRVACESIADLCCGIGATTVHLAQTCDRVWAVDVNPERIRFARENAKTWRVEDKIEFLVADVLDPTVLTRLKADVVVTDVEWAPHDKPKGEDTPDISRMQPSVHKLFEAINRYIGPNIVMRMSRLSNVSQLQRLGQSEIQRVSINGVVHFCYVYYGGLRGRIGFTEISFDGYT